MNTNDIEAFLLALKLGSFSAAANHLGTSQPTISARLSKLESQVGQKLFHRTRHPLRPTQKALEILPFAEQLLESSQKIRGLPGEAQSRAPVSIRIGTHTSFISGIVPLLLAELADRFPQMSIDFDIGTTYVLRDKLERGAIDFCIMEDPVTVQNLHVTPLLKLRAKWMSRRGSVPNRTIEGKDLKNYTIVTYKRWTNVYRAVETGFRQRRCRLNNLVTSESTEAIISALSIPNTIGTVYKLDSDLQGYPIDLEEVDVGIELPQNMITLCYMTPPRFMSQSQLHEILMQIVS